MPYVDVLFKSLEEIDKKLFDEIQMGNFSDLCNLDVNKYNPPNGKLTLCGMFLNQFQIKKILFIGMNPSIRRFDMKLRAFFPSDLNESSSGALFLNGLIKSAMIDNFDIYITNILKCSTKDNELPEEKHVDQEFPILLKEIELVNPDVIVLMGNFANELFIKLYKGNIKVEKIRHPSYFYRSRNLEGMKNELILLSKKIDMIDTERSKYVWPM